MFLDIKLYWYGKKQQIDKKKSFQRIRQVICFQLYHKIAAKELWVHWLVWLAQPILLPSFTNNFNPNPSLTLPILYLKL